MKPSPASIPPRSGSSELVLTPDQLRTLRHMLGIDDPSKVHPVPYRNHYCANPGDLEMQALAMTGAVTRVSGPTQVMPYDQYVCTDAGIAAARASHKSIRLSKSQRIYLRFLSVSDAVPDLTFRDFLTNPEYRQIRAET